MADDKGFRKMNELVAALAVVERQLASGEMDIAGLDAACNDARELYERLVVLRHKAREAALSLSTRPKEHTAPPTAAGHRERSEAADPLAIRLDTRPESAPRQTSLIEAIEASEEKPARTPAATPSRPADKPASTKAPTLAEKMERAAIPDLSKAISLSHKFWFVAELFNGDRINYEKSIAKLNAFPDLAAAQAFIDTEIIAKMKKPADPEALATFSELVQRRYS